MSINTTSTSDPLAAVPSAAPELTQGGEGSAWMATLPDPAVIARLANEFFAALPGGEGQAHSPAGSATPDPALARLSFPAVPQMNSAPAVPPAPASAEGAPLNEDTFRAIAASLRDKTGLVPAASAPAPATPFSSPSLGIAEKAGPWMAAPQLPPAGEMFTFPGVPAMPPTAAPSGADANAIPHAPAAAQVVAPAAPVAPVDHTLAGGAAPGMRTDPWATEPTFPELLDVFSFPRVPGASVPGAPEATSTQPVTTTEPSGFAAMPTGAPAQVPPVGNFTHLSGVKPAPVESMLEAQPAQDPLAASAARYASAVQFPAVSEMFSFPGVPGAQSAPGTPVLPTTLPPEAPSEPAAPANLSTPAGVAGYGVQVPATPAGLSASNAHAPAPIGTKTDTVQPGGFQQFAYTPDVIPHLPASRRQFDVRLIREDFPILKEQVNGRQLIWLDNAATTQKPNAVIQRLAEFYRHENSNIHRAAHTLAARATDAYESAREKTRRFLNAASAREIVFVRGTTEGINLVAQAWGRRNVGKDDEIVISWLEHHANIVPWQQLCAETGARLRVAPVNDRGEVILEEYERLLNPRTRIVSLSQVSNALGSISPVAEMTAMAHRHGARVLVDGAQAVSHMRVDVQAIDCDFYVFSGHKVFGPTGIGAVYGKLDVLDHMPPWQGGGNMIVDVTFETTKYHAAPARFEAGTGNIADAVGLGAALDYVDEVGMENIAAYEHELLVYGTAGLLTVPGLRLIGTAANKASVMSFVLDDVRTEDVGMALSQ